MVAQDLSVNRRESYQGLSMTGFKGSPYIVCTAIGWCDPRVSEPMFTSRLILRFIVRCTSSQILLGVYRNCPVQVKSRRQDFPVTGGEHLWVGTPGAMAEKKTSCTQRQEVLHRTTVECAVCVLLEKKKEEDEGEQCNGPLRYR